MKIVEKMEKVFKKILNEADGENYAKALQEEAVKATLGGIESDDWKAYMKNFSSNDEQLQRLTGKDPVFASTVAYNGQILAYGVANATCGPQTTTRIVRYLSSDELKAMDEGVSNVTDPNH